MLSTKALEFLAAKALDEVLKGRIDPRRYVKTQEGGDWIKDATGWNSAIEEALRDLLQVSKLKFTDTGWQIHVWFSAKRRIDLTTTAYYREVQKRALNN